MKISVVGWDRNMGETVLIDKEITHQSYDEKRSYSGAKVSFCVDEGDAPNNNVWIGSKIGFVNLNGHYRFAVQFSVSELLVLLYHTSKNWTVSKLTNRWTQSKLITETSANG